jgi:hypothetical protein
MKNIKQLIAEEIDLLLEKKEYLVGVLLEQVPAAIGNAAPTPESTAQGVQTVGAQPQTASPQQSTEESKPNPSIEKIKSELKGKTKEQDVKNIIQKNLEEKQELEVVEILNAILADDNLKNQRNLIKEYIEKYIKEWFSEDLFKKINLQEPDESKKVAQQSTPPQPQQIKESKLQKLAREYVHYKRLYLAAK